MEPTEQPEPDLRNRRIYILPNLFTTASLFAGFYAIIQATQGHFDVSAAAIFIAAILDSLDGRVARMTNTVSDFGKEYDSLSDVIAFGLTPALVSYEWALSSLGKVGWLISFLFVACAALRLARFNSMTVADKRYFQGIPCPAAAAFVAAFVWMIYSYDSQGQNWQLTTLFITVIASLAMVSNIPYYSFKDINLKGRMPFVGMIVLVIIFLLISWDPPNVLFILCLLYFISGPIGSLPYFRNKFSHVKSVPDVLNLDEDNDPEV